MSTRFPWDRLWAPETSHWRGTVRVGMGRVFSGREHGLGTAHPEPACGCWGLQQPAPPQESWAAEGNETAKGS